MENTPTIIKQNAPSIYSSMETFEHAQRMAKSLCESDIVPVQYKGKMANTLIALEMSHRLGDSPFVVMQNLDIIQGKPSWKSTYIIAKINSCGRFAPLRFKYTGEGDDRTCVAWTKDFNGDIIEGTPVSIKMAKVEGWYGKQGSKWPAMPDQMLSYRAASFFGRLYVPELLAGMQTAEEVIDITHEEVKDNAAPGVTILNQKVNQKGGSADMNEELV